MSRRRPRRWPRATGGRARQRRLFGEYVLIFASLVGAALLVSGLLQLWFTYQQTSTGQGRLEREQAATAAATILQFFTQIEPQLRLVNQSAQATGSPGVGAGEQRRAQYEILITQSPPITTLHYVDEEGRERLAISRLAATVVDSGIDFSQDASFIQARRTGTTAYSSVEFHDASEPYLNMAVPEHGAAAGILLAEVNLKFVGDVVSRLTTGQAGYAYVVDGEGRLIAHHDVNLVLQNHDLSRLAQVQAARAYGGLRSEPALLGGSQDDFATIGRDLRGQRVLSAHQSIDPPGWTVFVDQPLEQAYAPVYSSILRTAALLIAGLALAVLTSFALARRMVAPIRALQAGAARIGAGNLEQQISLQTGDEHEELGESLNQMSARLRESYANLETKVEERTQELGRAMALLEQKSELLAIADSAKSEFLSRMSHELRTPLNAIIGFTEIMELDPQTPDGQQEWIRHVLKAGRHLLGLIDEVLDIARIETGRLSLSLEPVGIDETVNEVLDLVHSLAARSGIKIEVQTSAGVAGWVRADRQRLQQVLLNLLTNAIKYNHAGGSVTVTGQSILGARLRLTVCDTGPGIPLSKLGRLFTPFDRLGAEESGIEGNGLGLAISKRLVEAMDGAIGVDSTEGQGSAFWIALPTAASPAAPLTSDVPASSLPSPNGAPKPPATVLYIEDNLSNLELMKGILAFRPGVTLLSAMQGTLGLILACQHAPDLILLDLNLPDMHGDDVLTRLRQDDRTRGIPVAVISADATPAQQRRTLELGACAYLTKPVDVRRLLALVEEVLAREGATL